MISLLWRGIAEYAKKAGTEHLFGLSSITTVDVKRIAEIHRHFAEKDLIQYEFGITPRRKYRIDQFEQVFANTRSVSADSIEAMPPLFKTYIKAGAKDMFAAGDRPRLQLRRLVDRTRYAGSHGGLRQEVYARLRASYRIAVVCGSLVLMALVAFAAGFSSTLVPPSHQEYIDWCSYTHVRCVRFLDIRCQIDAPKGQNFDTHSGLLIIPNHISYLDVIVVNALFPAVFVTSREIEETPVLGQVTSGAGCAFVERRHKQSLHRDIDQLSSLLNQGINVALFPEGTTSAGEQLLPFKKSLFEAAVRSRCQVVPVCIRYQTIDGQTFDASNRDTIAWYGSMQFFPHLWQLMMTKSVEVRLSVLGEVAFRGHRSRKRLADDARAKIAEHLATLT